MKIILETIYHCEQRYPTVGDYQTERDGTTHISVSKMGDRRYELLVGIHELIEHSLVKERGIDEASIDTFDLMFEEERREGLHSDTDEPGSDPRAPYHAEHEIASHIERVMAIHMGVDWNEYEKAVNAL